MPVKKTSKQIDATKENMYKTLTGFLGSATLLVFVIIACAVTFIVMASTQGQPNKTITVSGMGEAFAVPDIATLNLTMTAEAQSVEQAQETITERTSVVLGALRETGVAEKDIQTTQYRANPRYEFQQKTIICELGEDCPPSESERVLVGYEVEQSLRVTVRDIDNVGTVLGAVGDRNVDRISGPFFEIEDEDAVKDEARAEAIDDAEAKAAELARQLGVRLGKVVDFYEDGGYGGPMPYAATASFDVAEEGMARSAPSIPMGENEVRATVSITYKIK